MICEASIFGVIILAVGAICGWFARDVIDHIKKENEDMMHK